MRSGAHTPQQIGDPFASVKVKEDAVQLRTKAGKNLNQDLQVDDMQSSPYFMNIQKAKSSEQRPNPSRAASSTDDAHLRLTFMKQKTEPSEGQSSRRE